MGLSPTVRSLGACRAAETTRWRPSSAQPGYPAVCAAEQEKIESVGESVRRYDVPPTFGIGARDSDS
jgi:hypothetical protein